MAGERVTGVLVTGRRGFPRSAGPGCGTAGCPVRSGRQAGYICAVAGDPITRAEWAKYLPGVPYHPPCPRQ